MNNNKIFENLVTGHSQMEALVLETLKQEELVETQTTDTVSYNRVIGQMQRRAYERSITSVISPIIFKGVPKGNLLAFSAEYGGPYSLTGDKQKDVQQLRVVTLTKDNLPDLQVGSEYTTSDGVKVTVLYKEEGSPNFLVQVEDGKELTQFTQLEGADIELINSAQFGSGQMFKDYGKWIETVKGETDDDLDTLQLRIYNQKVDPVTAKIRTDMTLEFVQDLQAALSITKSASVSLQGILRDLLALTMDQKYLEFAKWKATARPKLVLKDGLGIQTGLKAVYGDLYANINIAIGEIGTDTMTTNKYWVAASSNVVAALRTLKVVNPVPQNLQNVTRIAGVLDNGAVLIEDGYSFEDYFLVGLRGERSYLNFPSILFIPYGLQFLEVVNPSTEEKVLGMVYRMILAENGMDRKGQGEGESLQVCEVDMTGLPNQSLR